MAFDPFNDDGDGKVVETTLPDGTRARNIDQPTPFDEDSELAPIADPVADQMAEELIRLGLKDADAVVAPEPVTEPAAATTDSAVTPAAEEASASATEPPAVVEETPSPTAGWEYDFGGQVGKVAFTNDEIRDALIRDATFAQKPPETWAILSDLEAGRSVPISRAQWDEYQQLKTQGSRPAALSDDDLQFLDPAVAKRVRDLEALAASAHTPAAVPAPTPVPAPAAAESFSPQDQAREQARLAAINDLAVKSLTDFQAVHSLSEAEVKELESYAAQMNLVQRYAREHETRSYDGTVLNTDFSGLFNHVLNDAYNTHPKFVQRKIDVEVQRRLDAEQAGIAATNRKRNIAGQVATAPSAATTTPNEAPRTRAETTAAITEFLRQEGA